MADAEVNVGVNLDPLKQAAELSEALHQHWKNLEETIKKATNELKKFAVAQSSLDQTVKVNKRKPKTKDDDVDEALGVAKPKTKGSDLKPAGWRSTGNSGPEARSRSPSTGRFIPDYYKKTGLPAGATYAPDPKTDKPWFPKGAHFAPDMPPGYRSPPGAAVPKLTYTGPPGPYGTAEPGPYKQEKPPAPYGTAQPGKEPLWEQIKTSFKQTFSVRSDDKTLKDLNTLYQRSSIRYMTTFPKFAKDFVGLSSGLTQGMWMLGRAGLGLGVAGGAAGLALKAYYDLERDAANKGKYAAGVGSTVGNVAGAETYLSRFGDVKAGISAVSAGAMTRGSDVQRTVASLGLMNKITEDPTQLYMDIAKAWAERAKNIPIDQLLNQANAIGISKFISPDTLRQWKEHPQDLDDQIAKAREHAKEFDWPADLTKHAQELNEALMGAWNAIERAFITNLSGLDMTELVGNLKEFGIQIAELVGDLVPIINDIFWIGNKVADTLNALQHPSWDWFKSKPGETLPPPIQTPELDKRLKGITGGLFKPETPGTPKNTPFVPLTQEPDYKKRKELYDKLNQANMPSQLATPKEFEIKGGGDFVIPGQDKVPQNIQDMRDAIIDSNQLLETLTKSQINTPVGYGGPGRPGGTTGPGSAVYRTGFGPEGTSVPTYSSGGMGAAGETTAPTRMTGEGRKGGGIRSSGLEGGTTGKGGTSSDDSGVAYGKAKPGSAAAMIFKGESKGDYNIYNYSGGRGVGHKDFSNMTVGQVMEEQRQGKIFAAGAYQIIPKTMQGAVQSLHIDPNAKFDKETQDKIFSGYLATSKKGRGPIEDYIKGKSDNADAALKSAAQEWASIQYHGRGMYGGINSASTTDAQMLAGLKNAREIYAKTGNYQGALFGEDNSAIVSKAGNKDAIAKAADKTRTKDITMPARPASTGDMPHMGDVSQYQMNPKTSININNTAGANVVTQTAMIGNTSGSFGSYG